jgi:hypothetical protein
LLKSGDKKLVFNSSRDQKANVLLNGPDLNTTNEETFANTPSDEVLRSPELEVKGIN